MTQTFHFNALGTLINEFNQYARCDADTAIHYLARALFDVELAKTIFWREVILPID
jgi:hypothetical protein